MVGRVWTPHPLEMKCKEWNRPLMWGHKVCWIHSPYCQPDLLKQTHLEVEMTVWRVYPHSMQSYCPHLLKCPYGLWVPGSSFNQLSIINEPGLLWSLVFFSWRAFFVLENYNLIGQGTDFMFLFIKSWYLGTCLLIEKKKNRLPVPHERIKG